MNIEERLKDLILSRYKSVREFSQIADIPYTTVKSILSRGIGNASFNNIFNICKALHISVDELAKGRIKSNMDFIVKDPNTDITLVVETTKSILKTSDHLMINGKEVDVEFAEPIFDALDIGYEMVKRKSEKDTTVE